MSDSSVVLGVLEGQCRCGGVVYRIDPPHLFVSHPQCKQRLLAAGPRVLQGQELLEGSDWQVCRQCGSSVLWNNWAVCSTLERPELPPQALHNAAYRGPAQVEDLLHRGMPVDAKICGRTPLSRAIGGGDIASARVLLQHGADPNLAVHWLPHIRATALKAVRLLLNFGCSAQALLGPAVLKSAPEVVRSILAAGADIALSDSKGRPMLALACLNSSEMMSFILSLGVNPEKVLSEGYELLHYCAGRGYAKRLRVLLEAGVSANRLDIEQGSALLCACRSGRLACARLLLQHGADVDSGLDDFTPLMAASRQGFLAQVELLIKHGADPSTLDSEGRSARELASHYSSGLLQTLRSDHGQLPHRWITGPGGQRRLKTRLNSQVEFWGDQHQAIVEALSCS